jgi:hypothetical protein
MCVLSWASASCNPQDLFRPVMGSLYLYTVWVKCRAFGCFSRWYIYLPLCFTVDRECSTKYTSAYLTLHLLGCDAVLFVRRVQTFEESRRFRLLPWRWWQLVPTKYCCMHQNTRRHVADDRKNAQPRESQISVYHSFPRKQLLFLVTWTALVLNQRLDHSCWRRLMLSRRHLKSRAPDVHDFLRYPWQPAQRKLRGTRKVGQHSSIVADTLEVISCVYAQMLWMETFRSKQVTGCYSLIINDFFFFRYAYSSFSPNP